MTEQEIEKSWAERGFSFGVGNIKVDAVDRAVHEDQNVKGSKPFNVYKETRGPGLVFCLFD